MKESFSGSSGAEHATIVHKIVEEPAFAWWARKHVLRNVTLMTY
jgi:hypothetical protein